VGAMATVEWKLAIEGRDAFGEVRRHEIHIDKSWGTLVRWRVGLSVEDGKKIQTAVVSHEADTYASFAGSLPSAAPSDGQGLHDPPHQDRLRHGGDSQSPLEAPSR
jgi:hypothetical protein